MVTLYQWKVIRNRIFERFLMSQLSVFLLPHIPKEQLGFIPGTGTLDKGSVLADEIAHQALQTKKDVWAICP